MDVFFAERGLAPWNKAKLCPKGIPQGEEG